MKFSKIKKVTYEVTYLKVDAHVRYHEDAEVNGVEDSDGKLMPFMEGNQWTFWINLDDGSIVEWPNGTTAKTHYKVCDEGVYGLYDIFGKMIAERDWYVPGMLGPGGYGDYIILDIDENGFIKNWNPDLSHFYENDD